jgi:hypothetical protein
MVLFRKLHPPLAASKTVGVPGLEGGAIDSHAVERSWAAWGNAVGISCHGK